MFFPDEIRDAKKTVDELPSNVKVESKDLNMAKRLVDGLTSEWEPGKYKDTYRERVLSLVRRKQKGQEIVAEEPAIQERPTDLMEALAGAKPANPHLRDNRAVHIHRLTSVDGFIAFDFDDARFSGGGTRYASDVTEEEAALLARAMTYKFAAIGLQAGGAKGAIRGTPEEKAVMMARYCEEIRPLVESRRFGTGPDLGTSEADFASIRDPSRPPSAMAGRIGADDIEDLITGFGVVVAAETAMGSLDGTTFAVEGFGKVGGGVAREVVRRGARVVAVSTIEGCVMDDAGLDVEALMTLRRARGDAFVREAELRFEAEPAALFEVEADVLVPGARTAVITPEVAERLRTRWV